jgi:predicted butyrate kinase (DUF1464 family)
VLPEADAEAPAIPQWRAGGDRRVGGGWISGLTRAATFVIKFCEAKKKKSWNMWLQRDLRIFRTLWPQTLLLIVVLSGRLRGPRDPLQAR